MDSAVLEAVGYVINENDNAEVSREEWIAGVNQYFDYKEAEASRRKEWSEDAYTYSTEGIDHVLVEVTSYTGKREGSGELMDSTDFRLTPEEARSMFLGIRDRYKGE